MQETTSYTPRHDGSAAFSLLPLTSTFRHLFLRPQLQTNLLTTSLDQGFVLLPARGHVAAVQLRQAVSVWFMGASQVVTYVLRC